MKFFKTRMIYSREGVVVYDRGWLFRWWHWLTGGQWVAELCCCDRCFRIVAVVFDDTQKEIECSMCGQMTSVHY